LLAGKGADPEAKDEYRRTSLELEFVVRLLKSKIEIGKQFLPAAAYHTITGHHSGHPDLGFLQRLDSKRKLNRKLRRAHFPLTPSDAAFTSTHPECG
jgi:hypothetical protein